MTQPFDFAALWDDQLATLHSEGRYRVFADLERIAGDFPHAKYHHSDGTTREVTVWCSNDYLGMGQHPKVLEAMNESLSQYGAGAGGTRNISGTSHPIVTLEETLAQLHAQERALVFGSGYSANEASLSTIGRMIPEAIFISDEANHASMIAGMRHRHVDKSIFPHNDVSGLTKILRDIPVSQPKIVAIESVYSMDGDVAPMEAILEETKRYGALLFVDEVHAVGLYGAQGGGISDELGIASDIDVITGTLAKAYGVVGGYVAANANLIDTIRSFAPAFIFTTAMPPHIAAGANASVRHLMHSSVEREQLHRNVALLKEELARFDLPVLVNNTHIVPVLVGDPVRCRTIAQMLLDEHGLYVQPINYPTVPRGTERLRLTTSPLHSGADILYLAESLAKCWAMVN